jgi:hypothetical protein
MEYITLSTILKKSSLVLLAKIFIPAVLFLAIMAVFSLLGGFHFDLLSRDPIQLLDGKPYYGIISSIGIILWCATSAILFFSSKVSSLKKEHKQQTLFLFFGGLLSLLMLIDDLFLMHDVVFPEYLNIGEEVFYFIYGLSVVGIFYFYRKIILNSDYILLILSFMLLGASAMSDLAFAAGLKLTHPFVVEDSLKFSGIISWFAYFMRTSYMCIKPVG